MAIKVSIVGVPGKLRFYGASCDIGDDCDGVLLLLLSCLSQSCYSVGTLSQLELCAEGVVVSCHSHKS